MSSAMESDADVVVMPVAHRAEWSDVSPLEVDDGNCVVAVQYTDEHRTALSYFRAVLASGEKSKRALELTEEMIGYNQADYTAWQHRWLCIEELDSDLAAEGELTEGIMRNNAKNYQLWNHRRKCAMRAGPSCLPGELDFVQRALDSDDKNYHAWGHRLAVVSAFGAWDAELAFVDTCLERDVRNNSAWQHRSAAVRHVLQQQAGRSDAGGREGTDDTPAAHARDVLNDTLTRELTYTERQIMRAPRNESAWNYLLGLFQLPGCRAHEMAAWPQVHQACMDALGLVPSSPPALAALAEYYAETAELAASHAASHAASASASAQPTLLPASLATLRNAVNCASLVLDGLTVADPMRRMYWVSRHQELKRLLNVAPLAPDVDMAASGGGDDFGMVDADMEA